MILFMIDLEADSLLFYPLLFISDDRPNDLSILLALQAGAPRVFMSAFFSPSLLQLNPIPP